MKIAFDVRGNKKQLEAAKAWLDPNIEEILYGGGKGGGKSWLGVSLIFGDAFIYPNTRYFIARKTLKDLTSYTTGTIQKVFAEWGINENMYKFDGKNNIWTLHNGSKIFYLDAKWIPSDPDYARFGSMEMTRGWFEEASENDDEKCINSLANSLGRWRNEETGLTPKLLQTCNPAKNYLYNKFYLPSKNNTLESHRVFIQALVGDNKALGQDYVDRMIRRMKNDEAAIQRLVYGNWEFDDNPMSLFDYEKILGIYTNEYVKKTGNMYLTADIAYEGSDIFAIGIWNGFVLEKIIAIDKINEVLVSKKIHELRLKYGIPISNVIYDADGTRLFVRNSSKEGNLKGAIQFRNNGKAYGKDNYANLKTQCYFKLAEMVDKGLIYIEEKDHRDNVIKELEQIRKKTLEDDGKIRLEKKSDLKLRLGRSPDYADMMMMRMFTEVGASNAQKIIW